MRIRLSDEDRERLGLEQEWVEAVDVARISTVDGELLDDHGYPAEIFLEELAGTPLVRDGKTVMVPALDDDDQPVLVDGKPKLRPRMTRPLRVRRALVWLALRRAGAQMPFDGFSFSLTGMETDSSGDPPVGKDPTAASPRSARSASGTRSPSRKSSGSARGKSTS